MYILACKYTDLVGEKVYFSPTSRVFFVNKAQESYIIPYHNGLKVVGQNKFSINTAHGEFILGA